MGKGAPILRDKKDGLNLKKPKNSRLGIIGGQALIEGVMMRGPKGTALAVRVPSGEIETEDLDCVDIKGKSGFFRIPLIRGIVGFIESLLTGFKALMRSAEKAGIDLEEDDGEEASKFEKWITDKLGDKLMGVLTSIAAVLGVVLAVFLFMYLPSLLFSLLQGAVGDQIANLRAVFEGVLKIAIFIGYIALVARMKEIGRVFQYHGAEHKTIFCYENGLDLTVENVRKQSRFHPRCGTSFLVLMLLVSILISSLLVYFTDLDNNNMVWVPIKILILPVIMGVGYEIIRFAGRHDNLLTRILSAPGMWTQRLTTKEPDDSMIEVAIQSVMAVLPEEDLPQKTEKSVESSEVQAS